MSMLTNFAQVLVLAIVGVAFLFVTLIAGRFFRPNRPNPVKSEIYECGEKAVGPAWINFNMRFYIIALAFVIFDVEAALIFPAAAVFRRWVDAGMGLYCFLEIATFVLILIVGFIYLCAKGDLNWVKGLNSNNQDH